jgi:hypothetical protein
MMLSESSNILFDFFTNDDFGEGVVSLLMFIAFDGLILPLINFGLPLYSWIFLVDEYLDLKSFR